MKRMNILGINMHCLSYEDMYPIFDNWLQDKTARSRSIALVNVNCCVSALFKPSLRPLYNDADIVGIDSMPFLKWARAFYYKQRDRFYAPDLMLEVASKADEKGYTFFFYGGMPNAPDKMEQFLKSKYPKLNVVGKYSPPFRPLTSEEDAEICKMINEAQPDFLWIGLGSPKQDVWIAEHREKIRGSIIVASGAAFDFFSGRIKQAPKYIRDAGFEWLYRLVHDFRRLWVRYTIYNIVFLVAFFLQQIRVLQFKDPT